MPPCDGNDVGCSNIPDLRSNLLAIISGAFYCRNKTRAGGRVPVLLPCHLKRLLLWVPRPSSARAGRSAELDLGACPRAHQTLFFLRVDFDGAVLLHPLAELVDKQVHY